MCDNILFIRRDEGVIKGIMKKYPDCIVVRRFMQLSHLPRFDHDWYRGLHRGSIGTIVSNLIRSHHILISIVIIGLIVEKFWLPKILPRLPRLAGLS